MATVARGGANAKEKETGAELRDRDLNTELLAEKGHIRCQLVAVGGAVGKGQIDRLGVEKIIKEKPVPCCPRQLLIGGPVPASICASFSL